MFTNPFRKYQNGGPVSENEKSDMKEFVSWLKSNKEGFKDKTDSEIAQAIVDMSKSEEGKESAKKLYKEFKDFKNKKSKFEDGGKFQSFICKHGHGGVNCGCGGKVVRAYDGEQIPPRSTRRAAAKNMESAPDTDTATNRRVGYTDINGNPTVYEDAIVNGNSAETWATVKSPGDTVVVQQIPTRSGNIVREYPKNSWQYGSIMERLRNYFNRPALEDGGILKGENGLSKAAGYYQRHANEGIIRKLQMFLAGRGYYDGDLTGKFDRVFYDAVKNYQKDNGLIDDGMWGEDTNLVHRVLGTGDTTFNGSRSGAHLGRHTYGSDFVNREYMTRGSVKMSDINAVIEKAIINPEWFWGDSDDAKAWRLLLEKGSPDGRGGTNYGAILEDIWRETPDEIKSRIPYSKLPNSIKSAVYNQGISNAINDSTPYVVGALSLPALANPLATLGAVTGAELVGAAGRNVGSDMQRLAIDPQTGQILGYVNQNDSPSPELVGFSTPTIIPDRSNNGEGLGQAIGAVLGAGIGNAANEAVIDLNYNPTGIEMKLGEPKLKLQEKRVIKPKGGGWRRPGTGDPSRFSGRGAGWVRRMTGEPIKDSEISGYILEREGGRIEKHQQENGAGRGKIEEFNPNIQKVEFMEDGIPKQVFVESNLMKEHPDSMFFIGNGMVKRTYDQYGLPHTIASNINGNPSDAFDTFRRLLNRVREIRKNK